MASALNMVVLVRLTLASSFAMETTSLISIQEGRDEACKLFNSA